MTPVRNNTGGMEGDVDFNINDNVSVRLTTLGLKTLLNSGNDPMYKFNFDKDSMTLDVSLWQLMQVFGPHIHMGMIGTLFEDNAISIEKRC